MHRSKQASQWSEPACRAAAQAGPMELERRLDSPGRGEFPPRSFTTTVLAGDLTLRRRPALEVASTHPLSLPLSLPTPRVR